MADRHIAERYATALANWDLTDLEELVHPDVTVRYPQSGETFKGADSYLATIDEYPGLPEMTDVSSRQPFHETVVVTPGLISPVVTVIGDADRFVAEFVATYPDGNNYYVVSIVRVIDGLIVEDTAYFGPPFDPPEWRSKYRAS